MAAETAPVTAVPQTPGGVEFKTLPGTTIPLPQGSGVERLIPINPPFRSNAPPWYTPSGTIWGQLGCAVPQPGRYLQTNNEVIYDFVNVAGYSLFDVMWRFQDRKFLRYPSRDCLYQIHQLLVFSRGRLVTKTTLPNESPLLPTHATPAPKMFLVYPVPFYGPLGCINQWLRLTAEMTMLMCSEAMQHADNELGYHITKPFFDSTYGYLKYLLVDMATKFFGVAKDVASKDDYVIPDALWQTYNPAALSVSVESTSSRPPMGLSGTDLDLEPIRGVPIVQVVPFLQPWPDAQLKYSTGGIWANSASPAADVTASGTAASSGGGDVFKTVGPP